MTYQSDRDQTLDCPACGRENGPMGWLGQRAHYRCRDCGDGYSTRWVEDDAETNDAPDVANCDDWGTGEGRYHGRM